MYACRDTYVFLISQHGTIPVWGFGTVVLSSHPEIRVGERVFGYLGMTRYLLLPVEEHVNKFNFYVPRPHLPEGTSSLDWIALSLRSARPPTIQPNDAMRIRSAI